MYLYGIFHVNFFFSIELQTEVTKLESPFDSDCITHWNDSEFDDPFFNYTYNVRTKIVSISLVSYDVGTSYFF